MSTASRVLVVDSSTPQSQVLLELLGAAGYEAAVAGSVQEAAAVLGRDAVDLVIVSVHDAAEAEPLFGPADDASLILRVAGSEKNVIRSVGSGVHTVLPSDVSADIMLSVVERALRDTNLRREFALLRARASEEISRTLIGRSSAIAQLRELIGRAAASQRTVHITGEAGVGKDLAARLVHDLSERAARPFVRLRCTDADAAALEQELFGLAATAGRMGRKGLLESARGGTVVLDECSALTHSLRTRVAQAIITRRASRVGDDALVRVDVRFVLTTRDSIKTAQSYGTADVIFDGVSVLPISIPPLRERRSDIPLLVQHFRGRLLQEQGLSARPLAADAIMSLLAQEWTGNVRELEHWVELDALRSGESRHAIGAHVVETSDNGLAIPADAPWTLEQLERKYILHVLEQEEGNQSRAAERLGIDRRTLYRKLKEYRELGLKAS
ncbi:MAG: sigma 54-interacting transcriptional regulator [bacterium]